MEAEVLGTVASTEAVATSETFRVGPFDDPDRYEIGEPVEAGAEGILYRGQLLTPTSRLSLSVAVKALQPAYSARIDQWAARWRDQVELLRSLQIPGLVGVREGFVGPLPHRQGAEAAGRNLYLVMNWVEGEALDHWVLRHRGVDVRNALKLLLPVAVAVDTMHGGQLTGSVPVVHRDIKPANILIGTAGSVLVDFGLTKGLSVGRPVGRAGTPGYIAPEVLAGGGYTPAADRYAFGATVFFLLTGRHPPTAAQPADLRHLLETSPLGGGGEAGGHIPEELVERVVAMLDPDPDRRPGALANWIAQLRQSSLDDEVLSVRLAPPAPAQLRRLRADGRCAEGTSGNGNGHSGRTSPPAPATPVTWATTGALTNRTTGTTGTAGGPMTTGTIGLGDPLGSDDLDVAGLDGGSRATPEIMAAGSGLEFAGRDQPDVGSVGAPRRGGAHRSAHRPPQHARHQRSLAARYALVVTLAVAVAVMAGDAGAIGHPSSPVSLPLVRVGAGGSSAVVSPASGVGNRGIAALGRPSGPRDGGENEKSATAPATTTPPFPGIASCGDSFLVACGPLRWSPPVHNRALTVKFSYSPTDPMPGQPVTFTVFVDDPDDAAVQVDGAYFGDQAGAQGPMATATGSSGCQTPHGTWTTPSPGPPGHLETQETYTYATAGSYQVHFAAASGQTATCAPDPYASLGQSATQTVVVDAPPPPPTTTTSTTAPPPPTTTTSIADGDGTS